MLRKMRVLVPVFCVVGCSNPSLLTPEPPPAERITLGHAMDAELKVNDSRRYRIDLAAQQVAKGVVMQQGVDVVVTTFDPSGKKLGEFDSPNGENGPEPFVVVGSDAGAYDIEVKPFPPPPDWKGTVQGKVSTKIDEVITRDAYEDALLATQVDSPRLRQLYADLRHHKPNAADDFWKSLAGHSPIVEPYPGDAKSALVTWVTRTDQRYAGLIGGPGGGREKPMVRIADTDLFYLSAPVPIDAALNYTFIADTSPPSFHLPHVKDGGPGRFAKMVPDANNPLRDHEFSRVELSAAPPAPLTQPRAGVPTGKVTALELESAALEEKRHVGIYTPPGFDPKQTYPLVIAFDGEVYGMGPFPPAIPLPTILDNLIADGKLPPVVAALVGNDEKRDRDLVGYVAFGDFVANEVVPKVRASYHAGLTPAQTLVTGSSLGGLESSWLAMQHSDVIGLVLSNSGSYWYRAGDRNTEIPEYVEPTLIDQYIASPKLPVRFYLDCGIFEENLRDANRRFRDVLRLKGYDVTYREFSGGHDYGEWKRTIADGLVALLGARS